MVRAALSLPTSSSATSEVANGKLAAVAGAVAGLTAAQAAVYEAAVACDNKPEIARLLREGEVANGKLAAVAFT